jgi:hypothetical protein
MWVQWTSIGANMLKEHFFKFLVIYCLIKILKAFFNIKEQLNKGKPLFNSFPFWESIT